MHCGMLAVLPICATNLVEVPDFVALVSRCRNFRFSGLVERT